MEHLADIREFEKALLPKTPIIPPAPTRYKYALIACFALLAFSGAFAIYRFGYHVIFVGKYRRFLLQNQQIATEMRSIQAALNESRELQQFFESNQAWVKNNGSCSQLLFNVYSSIPEDFKIQSLTLKRSPDGILLDALTTRKSKKEVTKLSDRLSQALATKGLKVVQRSEEKTNERFFALKYLLKEVYEK